MTDAGLIQRRNGLVCDKILRRHQDRLAIVYVRQSRSNRLSAIRSRRDCNMRWRTGRRNLAGCGIIVIDDDLRRSGASVEGRLGFQRLVAEVGLGNVGLVLGVEMSRLARSCRDWYQRLEICALFDTLIADADGLTSISRTSRVPAIE
jgi:DNA invertase Pin-like site-specific DNA recombinase